MFQSIYQLLVMMFLMYGGPKAGGHEYNLFTTEMHQKKDGESYDTYRCLHQTFMFYCFIIMNIFNMVNCRLVDAIP